MKISNYRAIFTLINIQIARIRTFLSNYRVFRIIELRIIERRLYIYIYCNGVPAPPPRIPRSRGAHAHVAQMLGSPGEKTCAREDDPQVSRPLMSHLPENPTQMIPAG